jgi:hypothetical protein
VCIPDSLKTQIKDKLASYLGIIPDPKLKNEFDVCLEAVSKHEFPQNFPALVAYLVQGLVIEASEIAKTPDSHHLQVL